eukprot:15464454-Alexandrium_andersonii.AAC.1
MGLIAAVIVRTRDVYRGRGTRAVQAAWSSLEQSGPFPCTPQAGIVTSQGAQNAIRNPQSAK